MGKELIIGIDDAGRGPVIGPMLLAGVLIEKSQQQEFRELGIMDSKLLTKKKRESLIDTIKEKSIAYNYQSTSPSEIDTGMGIGLNLNLVEALKSALIIAELTKNISEEDKKNLTIVIDCPSNNTEGWKSQLMEYVKDHSLKISCEHKADQNHVSVSAASIIAKVTRDNAIEKLHEQIGHDFGSGYPNDPKTREFLKNNHDKFKKERIFRESWATFRNAQKAKDQMKLPDY